MRNILKTNFVGICLAILAIVCIALSSNAQAVDNRNDMMCTAIYKMAFEQAAVEQDELKDQDIVSEEDLVRAIQLEQEIQWYRARIQLFRWNVNQNPTTYNLTVFNNFVERYYDELDTATALLHYDRCEYRVREVWESYQALKD